MDPSTCRRSRPSWARRNQRKLRRLANELRAVWAERRQDSRVSDHPVGINLQTTTACNLRCTMCELTFVETPARVMDRGLYRRIRDDLFEQASELSLTLMGEPFCVPGGFMEELLEDVEHFDLRLEITTNATRLPGDEMLVRLLGCTQRIMVSCDASEPATYENIRRPAKWSRFESNLERLVRLRRAQPLTRRSLLYFSYVLMRSNLEELPGFLERAAGWDGYSVSVTPVIEVHPDLKEEVLDLGSPEVQAVLRRAETKAFEAGLGFSVESPESWAPASRGPWGPTRLQRSLRQLFVQLRPAWHLGLPYLVRKLAVRWFPRAQECPYLWWKTFLQLDGEVGTCDSHRFLETGSVSRGSLSEIWRGAEYGRIRRNLGTDAAPSACRECRLGCRA